MSTEQPPPSSESRTFICTVVFVDVVGYSQQSVAQQVALKRHLNGLISRSLAHVAESDRMAIDTGDGAALCFFGDPEDALFAAASLREAITADPGPNTQVRIGINLGPARVVRDLNGNRNVIGDGINVAQRVMGFAAPNQILVSRSYYEVVSHISVEYAHLFQYAGLHRDKHIREHEVYEVQVRPRPGTPDEIDAIGVVGDDGPERDGRAAAARFPPALLTRLTSALARHLGPMAKLIVQRAALRAGDPPKLVATVAESLTGPGREAFLAQFADVATPPPAPSGPAPHRPAAPDRRPAGAERRPSASWPLTPAALAIVEERLARHLGPIARVLVAQAAKESGDTGRLIERLAAHIADPTARETFLAAMAEPP
jgi:class 3 adenylate cyclase